MFIGEYQHTIDSKGRMIMPSKFRGNLDGGFVMTKGLDNCLFLYPKEEWEKLQVKLDQLPLTNKDARAFVRFFYSGASECTLDKQGRTLIPTNLRDYGKIEKDIVIIGLSTRLELWSKDIWEDYNEDDNLSYDKIAETMAELGI